MLPFLTIHCPYCGEVQDLVVDDSAGDQQYVEDCQVCCRPMAVRVSVGDEDGDPRVEVRSQDEA